MVTAAVTRCLLSELFRRVADDRDTFLPAAVAWAFLFVLVFDELGLSVGMAAFLAGVSLAQLPYGTGLRDRITPLTNLFTLVVRLGRTAARGGGAVRVLARGRHRRRVGPFGDCDPGLPDLLDTWRLGLERYYLRRH